MAIFPKKYAPGEGPAEVLGLVRRLLPLLLEGDHPALVILRQQLARAHVGAVELSGVGFFADIDVPPDAPTVEPADITGGDALIDLTDVAHGAGCVLFVREGRLSMLEGYTYGGEEWNESTAVLGVKEVCPIEPGSKRAAG